MMGEEGGPNGVLGVIVSPVSRPSLSPSPVPPMMPIFMLFSLMIGSVTLG